MLKKLIISGLAVSLAIGCTLVAWRFAQEPKKIPSEFLDRFFASGPEAGKPNGKTQDWRSVPMFALGDSHEIETISGIELKVYKGPDGKKHYVGPPGLRMSLDNGGSPLEAHIDPEKAAQANAMMQIHIVEMHKKMNEDRALGKH